MMLRLAGGDLNALTGLAGFVAGIGAGVFFLRQGYSLKRTRCFPVAESGGCSLVAVLEKPQLFTAVVSLVMKHRL